MRWELGLAVARLRRKLLLIQAGFAQCGFAVSRTTQRSVVHYLVIGQVLTGEVSDGE